MNAASTIHLQLPRLIGMFVGLSGEQVQAACLDASPARVELIEAVDVEGQLRELSLDRSNNALHAEIPAMAMLIKSRVRVFDHDKNP